jgi:anti-sigma B factor antagonist
MIEQRHAADRGHSRPPAPPDGEPSAPIRAPTAPEFRLTVRPDGERARVIPVGELDLMTAGALENEVSGLLERGLAHVVVDLRGLSFLDSTGIRALLTCHGRAQRQNASLSIILGDHRTRRPLEICGVLGQLHVIDP